MNEKIFLKFITTNGTILVRNKKEFDAFIDMLKHHNVLDILGPGKNRLDYDWWLQIAAINKKPDDPINTIVFEYQGPYKGLSQYFNLNTPAEWYGEPPMVLEVA